MSEDCIAPKKLYTQLKSRFASLFLTFQIFFDYRKAIELCYTSTTIPNLQARKPTETDCRVVETVLTTIKPFLPALLLIKLPIFLLLDSMATCIDLLSAAQTCQKCN